MFPFSVLNCGLTSIGQFCQDISGSINHQTCNPFSVIPPQPILVCSDKVIHMAQTKAIKVDDVTHGFKIMIVHWNSCKQPTVRNFSLACPNAYP